MGLFEAVLALNLHLGLGWRIASLDRLGSMGLFEAVLALNLHLGLGWRIASLDRLSPMGLFEAVLALTLELLTSSFLRYNFFSFDHVFIDGTVQTK
jgi:hypothetical protein